jgi:dTDP-4-amino-4,6-dideoxygalactose transaminase
MAKLAIAGGPPIKRKPFPRWPVLGDEEIAAVTDILQKGKMGRVAVFGHGEPSKVDEFREAWSRYCPGKDYSIPCSNCCTALELSLRNAGVGHGDEVITPASTWVATNLAPAIVGATTVFADVSPENYCLDPDAVEVAITPRTKAIIPVHIGGYCCEMDRITQIAEKHHLAVIEDCAQAHGSKYKGKFVGTWGHFGCFSFDILKLMTAGEGGVVICDEKDLGDHVYGVCGHAGRQIDKILSKKGRTVNGWNFRMTEFQAAILLCQLKRMEEQKKRRMENANYLRRRMSEIEGLRAVKHEPEQNYYSFMFKYDAEHFKGVSKKKFINAMKAEEIPMFSSPGDQFPAYRSPNFGVPGKDYRKLHLPVAERAFEHEAVGIHAVYGLLGDRDDMDDIIDAILKIKKNIDELVACDEKVIERGLLKRAPEKPEAEANAFKEIFELK